MVEKCWSKQQDESKASAAATVDSKPMDKSAREENNYTFAVPTNEVRLTTDHSLWYTRLAGLFNTKRIWCLTSV